MRVVQVVQVVRESGVFVSKACVPAACQLCWICLGGVKKIPCLALMLALLPAVPLTLSVLDAAVAATARTARGCGNGGCGGSGGCSDSQKAACASAGGGGCGSGGCGSVSCTSSSSTAGAADASAAPSVTGASAPAAATASGGVTGASEDACGLGLRSLTLFEQAADLGDVSAMYWLGHAYRVGDAVVGVDADAATALRYLNGAAGGPGCVHAPQPHPAPPSLCLPQPHRSVLDVFLFIVTSPTRSCCFCSGWASRRPLLPRNVVPRGG